MSVDRSPSFVTCSVCVMVDFHHFTYGSRGEGCCDYVVRLYESVCLCLFVNVGLFLNFTDSGYGCLYGCISIILYLCLKFSLSDSECVCLFVCIMDVSRRPSLIECEFA